MTSLAFVVACHGRHELASACLRQLRRTCDELALLDVGATAVLVSDEEIFERLAGELGFEHVRQANAPLGRKWNDGFERASVELDVDFVIPFGSDDAIDPQLVARDLPGKNELRCSRQSAVVSEDGKRLARLVVSYRGGDGVRTWPASMMRALGGRPAEDVRDRAMDTSMLRRLDVERIQPAIRYVDLHPLQIVDFKSPVGQLNPFEGCARAFGQRSPISTRPFEELAEVYPAEFVDEVERVYSGSRS